MDIVIQLTNELLWFLSIQSKIEVYLEKGCPILKYKDVLSELIISVNSNEMDSWYEWK